MKSLRKCQILDLFPSYVTISHFFHYTPFPYVTSQIVTNVFFDQRPKKIILCILYNWYITGTNLIDQLMNQQHV